MKTKLKSVSFVLLLTLVGFLGGCKKSGGPGAINCGKNAEAYVKAAQNYSESPTKANCEKLKSEVVKFLKSCPTFYTGEQKKAIEDIKNSPCE